MLKGGFGPPKMTCPALDALEGSTFADKYRLICLLGSGGMGYVYEAEQLGLDRSVAIKVLRKEQVESAWERFRAEAKAASRINHPHAVAIYDFGRTKEGVPFLVMEHLRGMTLSSLIEQQPLPCSRVVTLGAQILSAISEAHACGVVHCDLTSDNVIVERLRDGDDFAKVIDFGLARVFNSRQGAGIVGTPEYVAPEQIRELDVGPPADIYSMGILLYEMVVGRTPFAGADVSGIINRHLHDEPAYPQTVNPRIPQSLQDLILGRVKQRPQSQTTKRTSNAKAVTSRYAPRIATTYPRRDAAHHSDFYGQYTIRERN